MYESIDDLPIVCQINLPEAALKVYRAAYNDAWQEGADEPKRHTYAQSRAWSAVRDRFERDRETGKWMPKAATLEPHVARPRAKVAARR